MKMIYKEGKSPLWVHILFVLLATLVALSALAVPLLLANQSTLLTESLKSRWEVGSIAEHDVRSNETFYFLDEVESKIKREKARASVLPIFRHSLQTSNAILAALPSAFQANRTAETLVRELVEEYLQRGIFNKSDLYKISAEEQKELFVADSNQSYRIEEVLTVEEALNTLNSALLNQLSPEEYQSASRELSALLKANMYYGEGETALAREQAALSVAPVVKRIEKGQLIIKKDFLISEEDFRALQAMRKAEVQYTPLQILGRLVFVIVLTTSGLSILANLYKHTKRQMQFLLIVVIGLLISQILTYLTLSLVARRGFATLDPFLPYFILPILVALASNNRLAGMVSAAMLGAYALLLPSSNASTFFFVIAVAFCGIYFIRFVYRRLDILFQWFFCVVASACIILLNNLINGVPFKHFFTTILVMSGNISLTFVLFSITLPVLEYLGNLPTTFRLRELAYGDSPILTRLAQSAVGTYNHSLAVADMAYNGAKAIDGDALLARVGGLYHDIGKLENPDYFIENQSDYNKHDELKASLSVAVIKSHVKIGLEKGREAHLPLEVLDIISQHHGNDVIAIFLKEAQEAASGKEGEQVKREDYAYNSLIPQTPEAAVVMLADSIEAASRTIVKPSAQKYEKLINQIIYGKIERKQLASSRLSLTDLDILTKSFMQTLTGRYHSRIEYPQVGEE